MKKLLILLFIFLFYNCIYANPIIKVPVIEAPTIDGNVTEWEDSLKLETFYDLFQKTLFPNKINVWIGCDDTKLYLAYRIYKPTKPKSLATDRKVGKFWEDDDIEFFINPDTSALGTYQILTNATGSFREMTVNGLKEKELDIVSAAHVSPMYDKMDATPEDLYWEGEMSITFESLGITKDSDIRLCVIGEVTTQHDPLVFVFTDITNKIQDTVFDVSKYAHVSFGSPTGIQFLSPFGNEFSNNKEIIAKFKTNDKEIISKICPPGNNNIELPKGYYLLKTDFYSGSDIIYSNTVEYSNIDVLKTDYDKKSKKYNIELNLSHYEPFQNIFITLSQGERVYEGYCLISDDNHKVISRTLNLSQLEKGQYTLSINILDKLKEDIVIIVD